MQDQSDVQGRPGSPGSSDHAKLNGFGAKLILHLLYDNQQSADVASHKRQGYATASVASKEWFQSKEAFMAVVLKAFENFYEEMKK